MKFVRLFSLAALTAATLLFIGAESKAAVITLPSTANSLQGNSFTVPTVPGLSFSFSQVLGSGTVNLPAVTVAALSPTGATQAGAVAPFGFQLAGAGIQAGPGQVGDLLINFSVSSPLPILSVTLFATGGATGNGSASITEIVTNPTTGVVIGQATIVNGTVTITLTQALTTINVSKDIAVNGGTQVGVSGASYSDIRQTFNTVIPEPTSVIMLGLGLVGVGGLGLRRAKANA
jgi:hypothetical protein